MTEGVLQQIDSPKNIYNDPDNLFVAGFIGAPPMNLIQGEIESGNFFAEGCLIKNVDKDSKKDVILGIRPEDMEIVQKGTSHLEATLYSIELTGDQTIVTSKMGSNFVTIVEDKDFESDLDLPVKIKLDKAKIFFFDSLSGERIRS